jgi:2-polyprenyl-3-methyl-5-hydroxy-6-metoxy-1,4-benzoquinol methylase
LRSKQVDAGEKAHVSDGGQLNLSAAGTSPYEGEYDLSDNNIPQVWIIQRIPAGVRVLDVGCAGGRVARHLREKGCIVTGIERDPVLAEKARRYCAEVIEGDVEDPEVLGRADGLFDYVVLSDILEHLVWPEHLLVALRGRLSQTGRVLAAIPNVLVWHTRKEFLLGRFEYQDSGTLDRTHLRFFTPKTARQLALASGYRVADTYLSYHVPGLNRAVQRMRGLLWKIGRPSQGATLHALPRALARLLPGLFANHLVLELVPVDLNDESSANG